jgi:acetate kinase
MSDLFAIGHRVVHGGEEFREPTLIDDEVIAATRRQIPLAPLHNPANLLGIEVTRARLPDVPQVAVFDTAFHHSLPPHAYHYAIPYELYEILHVRRYGFHGTSHQYVANAAASYLQQPPESLNLIVLHLGNGASAAAIRALVTPQTSAPTAMVDAITVATVSARARRLALTYLSCQVDWSLAVMAPTVERSLRDATASGPGRRGAAVRFSRAEAVRWHEDHGGPFRHADSFVWLRRLKSVPRGARRQVPGRRGGPPAC